MKQAERRNQRASVALNYFEEGKKVFFDLVKDADIFMEASKAARGSQGITDDVLWELNPKMVIVHVSGFGQEGDPKMAAARVRPDGHGLLRHHHAERHGGAAHAPRTLRRRLLQHAP